MRKKVLFICRHNSARSQIAEELLRKLANDRFKVESAGLEAKELNPLAIAVLKEVNVDISNKTPQTIDEAVAGGKNFDYVISVCDTSVEDKCPVFLGKCIKLHWNFADPSEFVGGYTDKLNKTRVVRDQIEEKIENWLKDI